MDRVTLDIEGMSCDHCVRSVQQALAALDGVEVQEVAVGTATVAYDATKVTRDRISDAIADEGYQVVGAR